MAFSIKIKSRGATAPQKNTYRAELKEGTYSVTGVSTINYSLISNFTFSTITNIKYKIVNKIDITRYNSNFDKNNSFVQPSAGNKNLAKKFEIPIPSLASEIKLTV